MHHLPVNRFSAVNVKRGQIKSVAAGQICGLILADFEQKGPKRGRKIVSVLLSSIILGKFEKYYFLTHTDKKTVFFLKPKFLQKVKITMGSNFFPQRPNFSFGLADRFCQCAGKVLL